MECRCCAVERDASMRCGNEEGEPDTLSEGILGLFCSVIIFAS